MTLARQRSEQRRWDFRTTRISRRSIAFADSRATISTVTTTSTIQGVSDLVRQNNNFTSLLEYQLGFAREIRATLLSLQGTYLFNRTKEDFGTQQTNQRAETGQLGNDSAVYLPASGYAWSFPVRLASRHILRRRLRLFSQTAIVRVDVAR